MKRTLLCISALLMLISCGDDEERLKMRRDIANLQEQIYQIERSQKEMSDKVNGALAEIDAKMADRKAQADQREQVANLREGVSQLEARLADLEAKSARTGGVSSAVTAPSSSGSETPPTVANADLEIQFNTSYGDFTRGKYELAAYGFEELLNNFPNSPFTEQCHYYLGRCYFELKKWQQANQHFDSVVSGFPTGSYLKPAMLYQGQCYYFMNSHSRAVSRLQELVSKFPDSQEANLARTFLKKAGYEK
ncbi:MAG: tetratricopeptide repeat protein [Acidobacteria bacterium]|nr:tetratricopeptide repeat protein [Acidobacteriota bacterium]